MKLFIILIVLALTGYENSQQITLPLKEADVKRLMAEKMHMDLAGFNFSKKGEIYSFSSKPSDPNVEGITYNVNGRTGTVYYNISGLPQANLVVKNSPNLSQINNGEVYIKEITKLAKVILDENGLSPDNSDWISGGYGDGYLYGDVKKDNKTITIKFDIFTKEWVEIKN
jgi:bla regulator protein BlaR1